MPGSSAPDEASGDAADTARLIRVQRRHLWQRQVLNPLVLENY